MSGAVLPGPQYAFMRYTETALSLPPVTISVGHAYSKSQLSKHVEAKVRSSCRVSD